MRKRRKGRGQAAEPAGSTADLGAAAVDLALFRQRVAILRERVRQLFSRAQSGSSQELLDSACDELQRALDALQIAEDAMLAHDQQRQLANEALASERRSYVDLFEQAPVAYVVTSVEGTIRQANAPAAELLQTEGRQLIGRSLALFVPDGSRRDFRSRLPLIAQSSGPVEWYLQLQPWEGAPFDVLLLAGASYDTAGRPFAVRWLLHQLSSAPLVDLSELSQAELDRRIAQLGAHLERLRLHALQRQTRESGEGQLEERAVGM